MTGGVLTWPAYLLTNIPIPIRLSLSAQAQQDDVSVADTIRNILCTHYSLDCPPVSSRYEPWRDQHSTSLLLRAQPALFQAVKADAKAQRRTMRWLILNILTEHDAAKAA